MTNDFAENLSQKSIRWDCRETAELLWWNKHTYILNKDHRTDALGDQQTFWRPPDRRIGGPTDILKTTGQTHQGTNRHFEDRPPDRHIRGPTDILKTTGQTKKENSIVRCRVRHLENVCWPPLSCPVVFLIKCLLVPRAK